MNAFSRIEGRTGLILGLLVATGLVAVASSVIHAFDSRPELQITFSHFGTSGQNDEYRYAVMEIRNVGNAPARFYGYSPDSPSCDLVQKDENGLWQNRIFKCGTGLSPQLMFPGEQITTTNYLHGKDQWKLGLTYTKPAFRDRLPTRVQAWLRFLPAPQSLTQQAWSAEMPPAKIAFASNDSESP
jgi:hypothetical protein